MICYISGIRLPQSGLTTITLSGTQYKVCTYFLRQWVLFAGPVFWDGTPIELPAGFDVRPTVSQSKPDFFRDQFSCALDIILVNQPLDDVNPFAYIKVLIAAALRYDAILTGILTCQLHLCIKVLVSETLFDIPGDELDSYERLVDVSDLLYATFVCLVQEPNESTISFLNAFGKVSVQNIMYFPWT